MKTISIGRAEGCNITINDPAVSRRHALIRIYPLGKIEIIDYSHNGTFLNGIRIKSNLPVPVKRKDCVTFANDIKLDWNLVPNPMKKFKIAAAVLLGIVAIVSGIILYNHFNHDNTSSQIQVDGTTSVKTPTEQVKSDEGEKENSSAKKDVPNESKGKEKVKDSEGEKEDYNIISRDEFLKNSGIHSTKQGTKTDEKKKSDKSKKESTKDVNKQNEDKKSNKKHDNTKKEESRKDKSSSSKSKGKHIIM